MSNRIYHSEVCYNVSALFNDYLDGELDDATKAQVEVHMRNCPDCAAEYDAYRAAVLAIHNSARHPKRSITGSVMAQIRSPRGVTKRKRHIPFGTIAALVAVVAIVAFNRDAFGFFANNLMGAQSTTVQDENISEGREADTVTATEPPQAYMYAGDVGIGESFADSNRMIESQPLNQSSTVGGDLTPTGQPASENMDTTKAQSVAEADTPATESGTQDQEGNHMLMQISPSLKHPSTTEETFDEPTEAATEQPVPNDIDAQAQMAAIGAKIKEESGFSTPVYATYMINLPLEELQQEVMDGIESRVEMGIYIISINDEGKLLEQINAMNDVSYYSQKEVSSSKEIAVIFY